MTTESIFSESALQIKALDRNLSAFSTLFAPGKSWDNVRSTAAPYTESRLAHLVRNKCVGFPVVEQNQIHNFMSSFGSGTVINYGFGSDFLTSYGSGSGSGSTSQKVTVPTVPVPQHWFIQSLPILCWGSESGTGSVCFWAFRIQIH